MPRVRSLRTRITAAATLIVAIVMVLASLSFSAVLGAEIRGATTRTAETRAAEIAVRVDEFGVDAVDDLDDDIVQVVDGAGAVVASSDDAREGALPADRDGETVVYDGERVLVVVADVDDDGGRESDDDDDEPSADARVVLAVSVEDDDATLATAGWLLTASTLLVAVVVAAVTWWVVGRALRPVERIRREVDEITGDRLDRRVVEPSSGDEIAALAGTMNRMLDRLDASATAQRRFVSDASHELRSPPSRPCASTRNSPVRTPRRRPLTTSPRSSPRRGCGCRTWSTACSCSPGSTSRSPRSEVSWTSTTSPSPRCRACAQPE